MKFKMRVSIFAILAIIALPAAALAQAKMGEPAAAPQPTKADAAKVTKLISSDKAKTATYCEIVKLGEQMDEAAEKKDEKKLDELAQKADELGDKLGPEYIALIEGLQALDPDSKEAEEIGKTLDDLDKLCGN